MQKLFTQIFISLTFFSLPFVVGAQIIITEIMYNPEGTDSDREWIEIYNSGTAEVDLSQYKLLENGSNHRLSLYNSNDLVLEAGEYAIVSDDPLTFLVDFSQSGLLIDSAFGLNNTGEPLSIIDPSGQSVGSVNYSVDWGANGTGNSLQLNGSDWIPAQPTPWLENRTEADDENSDTDDSGESNSGENSSGSGSDSQSTHSGENELSDYKPKIDLKISAGRDRYITINSPIEFNIKHNQDSDKKIYTKWSVGDGQILKGRQIEHIYNAPGTYNIVLNAEKEGERATARTKIYVQEPEINLDFNFRGKTVDIMLENKSKNEVNLGGFFLEFGNKEFKIADDTIVDATQTLILSNRVTKFSFERGNKRGNDEKVNENIHKSINKPLITLYFPSGDVAAEKELFPNLREEAYEIFSQYFDLEKIHTLDLSLGKMDINLL